MDIYRRFVSTLPQEQKLANDLLVVGGRKSNVKQMKLLCSVFLESRMARQVYGSYIISD